MIRYIRLLTVFIFCCLNAFSQVSFYADSFTGGVTAGGYAPDCGGSGTGVISVNIPAGSTIRKAWLFSGRQGLAPSVTVELNGTSLTFDSLNQVSPTFQSFFYGGNSAVHAIDVTSIVSAADTSYILEVPTQNAVSDRFTDFYLFIAYNNPSLTGINTEFFLNEKDFGPLVIDTFNLATPVNSTFPVAVGVDFGYMCDSFDADSVWLNGTLLGAVYGPESNSGACEGPCTNFYYENNTLYGLSGNNPDQVMNGPDVLSNAQAIITNNSSSFTMKLTHGNADNAHWGFFIVSAGCAAVIGSAGSDTAVCIGNPVQLEANGGNTYHWSPGADLNDSTIADPIAVPQVTTTYSVTVSNGCNSITDTVHVIVYQSPPLPNITRSGNTLFCSVNPSYRSYQWFIDDSIILGATDTSYFATKSGNYNVEVTDNNGCLISVGINIIILGISNYYSGNVISLYPNPASNELIIHTSPTSNWQSSMVSVMNVLGQETSPPIPLQRESGDATIYIGGLSAGIYFVQITTEKERWVGRFVKQ